MTDSNDKIRICMMMPKCHIGGAEVQVMGLLKNIDRSRFAVSLCLFNHGIKSMEIEAAKHAADVQYLGFRWRYFPVVFLKMVKYLRHGRFDVVHAHLAWAGLVGRLAAWVAGVPVRITTEHGKGLWKSPFQVLIEKAMNRITDMRICVSRDIFRIRRDREGTPEEKLVYIPNGVDPEAFSASGAKKGIMEEFDWSPSAPLILSIGRIVEAKNYPLLVEAFSILLKSVPHAKCIIVGEGPCQPEVEAAIERYSVGASIRLAGTRRDIPAFFDAADTFVLSSVREGLPVTLLEAMAAGTPIVATDAGGIPEAVTDGESAILVQSGDAGSLAEAMAMVLGDDATADRISASAQSVVRERFSIQNTTRRVEEIYISKLVSKKIKPPDQLTRK
ncbi:MAG: glycosyltransferase [Candidatus Krumholzibacteria bacterium]|nr:glycosyltransferase [Candidatus Krumholzibacteria bacterium]